MPIFRQTTRHQNPGRQRGAAALEYILVSTFAAVVAIAALGFVGKVVREQLATMASKLGITEVPEVPDPFSSSH